MLDLTEPLVSLGISLAELAIKSTATTVATKVKAIKDEKNAEKIRNTYDELINELLSERQEAIRIAQAYKDELEKVRISEDDIKHLHNTVTTLLKMLASYNSNIKSDDLEKFLPLLSVDTLRTMQLLGFNYKAAIGQPLTELCSNKISSLGKNIKNINNRK